jgi:hypothetical protein
LWNLLRIVLIGFCSVQLYGALLEPDRLLRMAEQSASDAKGARESIERVRADLGGLIPHPTVYLGILCALAFSPYARLNRPEAKWVRHATGFSSR